MNASTNRASAAQSRDPIVDRIVKAVRALDPLTKKAGDRLRAISKEAVVDLLEVFPDEVRVEGDEFEGPVTLHVTLTFSQEGGALTVAESFPGIFSGRIVSGAPVIDELDTDASSFFS